MSLPRLPDALGELETMRDALGGEHALMLTGADALKSRVIAGNLGDYGVIAFATHGLVGGEMRGLGEPALVLSPPQEVHDAEAMLLTATDIASLRLNADWVVLSACNTAAGEDGAAPTYSGLARAFVYAGVRSLLLSQWALRDDVAARLTVDAVKGARAGLGHAEALRQAQLRLIADRSVPGGAHPAAWAPFVLLGE
jgi:CHAT domain-containing protein